jgi:RNA polymerase sigma-70 factor (ECF subfamily)
VRDADSFDQFYRGSRVRLVQYLYAAGGDLAEAQDAAQEAYARAWQRWHTVSTADDPEAWVRVVGWRIMANGWRKLRGRAGAYLRHGTAPPSPPPGDDRLSLVDALRLIPVEQRVAIVLHHILDLPVTTVAAETGVPLGTVKARLARGRRALAGLLDHTDAELTEAESV